ncbi:hypothetical protein FA10DRAFT_265544 [Acaromyces ingoldii]|uniref:Autophagy-related protein 27 n=1 Tax=Acaromyces ingoldii TaxID=215250 RepID=A0A316YQ78_9BASI|nr:hypothetical protein FA10DRAFT_265544 [Acaromyces ingoldii]PWN91700.1 hypothetical protein FA10DRAFT_265544 [Acaromyces ingoldii]
MRRFQRSGLLAASFVVFAASAGRGADDGNLSMAQVNADCKNVQAGHYTFDLSKLPFPVDIKSSEDTPPTMTTTQISMNLCDLLPHEAVPDDEQCPKGARVCMKVINEKKGQPDRVTQVISTAAAEGDDADAFKWSTDLGRSLEGSEKALSLDMKGLMYGEKRQRTQVQLLCDRTKAPDAKPEFDKYDREDGLLKITWATPHACAVSMGGRKGASGGNTGRGGDGSGSSSGGGVLSSFFSWFFFLVFVGGAAYLAIGLWRNYNEYGVIELPNKDFWREAPYIAQDMGRHVYRTVSGQGSGRGAYEPV